MNNYQLSIKNYQFYKDSGVEWIGEIPEHWEVKHLKNIVSVKITDGPHETPVFTDDGIPFISAEAIQNGGVNFDSKRGYISKETDGIYSLKCKPRKNDIFIVKSGSTTGKIGYVSTDINFNIWSPLALVRANKVNYSRHLFYFLSSSFFQRQVQMYWSLGTQPNIGMKVLENLQVVIPPLPEQKSIALYLDTKTAQINRKIDLLTQKAKRYEELKRSLINETVTGRRRIDNGELIIDNGGSEIDNGELIMENDGGENCQLSTVNYPLYKAVNYPLYKDSAIEWIGKIPEHWNIKRIKDISYINKKTLTEKTSKDYEFDYIDISSVTYGVRGFVSERMKFGNAPSRAKRVVEKGDTIISTVRTYLKAVTSFEDEISNIIVSTGFAVVSPKKFLSSKYFSYLATSKFLIDKICSLSVGVSYPATNASVIADLLCLVPPMEEQEAIADYLDTKTFQIDQIIQTIRGSIEKQKELRKTLINDVVTGKIKIIDNGE